MNAKLELCLTICEKKGRKFYTIACSRDALSPWSGKQFSLFCFNPAMFYIGLNLLSQDLAKSILLRAAYGNEKDMWGFTVRKDISFDYIHSFIWFQVF